VEENIEMIVFYFNDAFGAIGNHIAILVRGIGEGIAISI